jgi:hypothetical protein
MEAEAHEALETDGDTNQEAKVRLAALQFKTSTALGAVAVNELRVHEPEQQ